MARGNRMTTSSVESLMAAGPSSSTRGDLSGFLVYYGWVDEQSNPDELYAVLRNALKEMPAAAPYRGPERFEEGRFVYLNRWEGELGRFFGREEIHESSRLTYQAEYSGGWVDRRRGV